MNKKQQDKTTIALATGLTVFICVVIPIVTTIAAGVWMFGK